MLLVLTITLFLASFYLLITKKTNESLYLFGICFSLMLHIAGMMIFISKKGGIPHEVMVFLFFNKGIQTKMRYLYITLNQLGYLMAIGRILYPLFLLKFSFCYSMAEFIKKVILIRRIVVLMPVLTLLVYEPRIYRLLTERNPNMAKLILYFSTLWISCYLIAAISIFLYEYISITKKFLRSQLSSILVSMLALTGIYFLYYTQDPGQVYRFYDYTFSLGRSIGYLQINPSLTGYLIIVGVSIVCCILGFYSLLNFTAGSYILDKENLVLQRKFDTARVGASMFVHGMKNQLLASKVIFKRIHNMEDRGEATAEKLLRHIETLENINHLMYERIEVLHQSIKQNAIYMKPVDAEEVIKQSIERFHKKYPDIRVKMEVRKQATILVDQTPFCEAIANLLLNGYEAIMFAEREENASLSVICYNERLYTIIEVRDNGIGISEKKLKKIFYPFYSSKNSKTNWGMGLYFVKETVKSHYGIVRVESKKGEGTSFYLLLPRYS